MSSLAREVYDKMIADDHCSKWMGIVPIVIEEGHCILEMTVKKEMLNGYAMLHGGIAYAFADSAFAFASNSYGRIAVSINGTMSYAKAAKEGDVLVAEAKPLSVGNKTADFDVQITRKDDGEKLYFFRGTVYRTGKNVVE